MIKLDTPARITPPPARRPCVGIFHPWMSLGGSEATTLWAIQALKDDHKVTLVTPGEFSLRDLNFAFGTSLMPWEFEVLHVSSLPGDHSNAQLPRLRLNHFEGHARRHAPEFDLCISGYHPIDFGRPGIHLVGDFAWNAAFSDGLRGAPLHTHHESALYRGCGWVADHFFHWRQRNIFRAGDLFVANSRWTGRHLHEHFGVAEAPVIPPPVPMPPAGPESARDPLGFVWIGHITREKRLDLALDILSRVRACGYPLTLDIVGGADHSGYAREMRALTADRAWVRWCGPLTGAKKWEVLRSRSFALHTNPAEPFGMAVAECAAAGCVPFVPADSGASELIDDPSLAFQSVEEAVGKIRRLLERPDAWARLSPVARQSAAAFRPEVFVSTWRRLVAAFLSRERALAA